MNSLKSKYFFEHILLFLLSRSLFLSWMSKKKQRQGSSVSILIPVLGVAVGVFAFLVVLSIMSGFVQNLKNTMLRYQPHIEIQNTTSSDFRWEEKWLEKLKSNFSEIVEIAPYQKSDVILQSGSRALIASLQGIPIVQDHVFFDLENNLNFGSHVSSLRKKMPSSTIALSSQFPTVILGEDLMNQLDLQVGDSFLLVSPFVDDSIDGFSPTQYPVVVAGKLNSGQFIFDQKIVFSSLPTANDFLNTPGRIKGYYLKIKHPMKADDVTRSLNSFFQKQGLDFHARSWTESNKSFLKALTLEHYGMLFVLIMVILVACFSITISLLLSIRKKSREMAILRSLGLRQSQLAQLYLYQGIVIGFLGIILGLSLGFLTLYFVHHYPIPFLTTSYSAQPLPVVVSVSDILIVVVGTFLLSILAALWPAYEVRDLNVIEILSFRN